jgi:hypothetical protein
MLIFAIGGSLCWLRINITSLELTCSRGLRADVEQRPALALPAIVRHLGVFVSEQHYCPVRIDHVIKAAQGFGAIHPMKCPTDDNHLCLYRPDRFLSTRLAVRQRKETDGTLSGRPRLLSRSTLLRG